MKWKRKRKKGKCWYDRKVQDVSYDVGEQVLLLLPLIGKPLQDKYCRSYTVEKRLGEVYYLISTPDRRKSESTVHVNLLYKYIARPSVTTESPSPIALACPSVYNREDQSHHVILDHLQLEQRGQLTTLL